MGGYSHAVPELPEVESARAAIERAALDRKIDAVDDSDSRVCRPHAPGEIAEALNGTLLTAVRRRGLTLWCDTDRGPALAIQLGLSGRVVITDADGAESEGGDHWPRGREAGDYSGTRFRVTFADGGALRVVSPRKLSRVQLDPEPEKLGPDAATVSAEEFAAALQRGRALVKSRLLDQRALAGVGSQLADEILWRAGVSPSRPVNALTGTDRARLYLALRQTVTDACRGGGVHALPLAACQRPGARCTLDGAELRHAKVAGRATSWCPVHQPE
jgi:formamidopyrimidine-DNA glycosylase